MTQFGAGEPFLIVMVMVTVAFLTPE